MRAGTVSSIFEIGREAWNRLAVPDGQPFNPFVSFDFFAALEASGSATAKAGWTPHHLVVTDGATITGIAPCYRKTHSQGEYVFDHGWAEAFERAGGRYYPKLQVAVPFTPVPGPRLFGDAKALAAALIAQCAEDRASSVHITFMPDQDLGPAWLHRTDLQFHWYNAGFTDFAAFLQSLSSAKRKNIRKERDSVAALGVTFDCLTGADIQEAHWDAFFDFYMDTGSRKWGRPYLTRAFFSMIGENMAKHILLVVAKRNGRMIAGALNLIGSDALYGRNWGALEQLPNLHFETCYYQAIDWAIAHKLQRVEAGAQGAHKLARGYLPQVTHSQHYLAHPGLARAVAQYLEAERAAVSEEQSALAEHSPFRHEIDS